MEIQTFHKDYSSYRCFLVWWIKLFSKHLLSKFLILEIFAKLDYFMVWSLIRNIKWSLQWYSGRDLQTGIFKIFFFFYHERSNTELRRNILFCFCLWWILSPSISVKYQWMLQCLWCKYRPHLKWKEVNKPFCHSLVH